MSKPEAHLADLIEPPRAGFWGANEKSVIAPLSCRVVRNGDVAKNGYIERADLPVRWFNAGELEKAEVQDGDIVLVSSGAYTGNAGKVIGSPDGHRVIASNFVRRLRPKREYVNDWVFHLVRSDVVQRCVPAHTGGSAIPNLSRSLYEKCPVPMPASRDAQQFKADVLNTVDAAIKLTEALIAKQQQVKAGLMHDLFTRGLTRDGQLRPTRAEAPDLYHETPLGWLPKEWSSRALAAFTQHDITYGIVQAGPHIEGGVPYIRTGDMAGDCLVRDEMLCTSQAIADSYRRSEIKKGEIVCSIRATVGKVLPVPDDLDGANLTQGTARISPNSKTDAVFLLWAIRCERTQREISLTIKGTTFMEITLGDLRALPIAAPLSKDEQREIGARLSGADVALAAETAHLGKLRQLKQGLMQALLTPPS